MTRAPIASISCIVIDGVDARRFAQMQFSGDVQPLSPRHWQWNAWLDAQGRVRALMHLADLGDGRLLAVLRGGDAELVRAELARYLLRMQANVAISTFGGYADNALEAGRVEKDGQDIVIGYGDRSLRLSPVTVKAEPMASNRWRLTDIRTGWPTLPPGEARFLSPAFGLERLGAVSFDKGCYPGQEIAARLHYRGGHKLRLHHLRGKAPLPTGAVRESGNGSLVHVLDSVATVDAMEALVVAPKISSLKINILENTYDIISTFGA